MRKAALYWCGLTVVIGALVAGAATGTMAQGQSVERAPQTPGGPGYIPPQRPDGLGPQLVCGTPDIDPDVQRLIEDYSTLRATESLPNARGGVIQVYWHVINRGTGLANGDIPNSQITSQINVLNAAYGATGFTFVLAATDRTTNSAWYTCSGGSCARARPTI